ncbi:MAG: HD domain-containing phosphohydrolase [Pseudomonadota bacterium]
MTLAHRRPGLVAERPFRVLAVDDDALQRLLIDDILQAPAFEVTLAEDGGQALALLRERAWDVLVLDRTLPGIGGDELCSWVRADPLLAALPVVMVTGAADAAELLRSARAGATDFVRKPYHPLELLARVRGWAHHKRMAEELHQAESVLFALAHMVESRDPGVGDHCARLVQNAVLLGQELSLAEAQLEVLRAGAVLHDIGKIALPPQLFTRRGPLSRDEAALLQQHPVVGAQMLAGLRGLQPALTIVRHHHERWDGGGYPDGLDGRRIPLLARVFQVVDLFDELVFPPAGRPALTPVDALQVVQEEAARGWRDPEVVQAFVALASKAPQVLVATGARAAPMGGPPDERFVDAGRH